MIALLSSVLVASALGSLHCAGMCGPLAAIASAPGRVHLPQAPTARASLGALTSYHGSRLAVYLVLGGAAGGLGLAVDASGTWLGLSRVATLLAGATMIGVGVVGLARAIGMRRGRRAANGPAVPRALHRVFGLAAALPPRRRAAVLGTLTGVMPCGWLWAFGLTAASTGTPLRGAAVMLAFWLGTVPALSLLGLGAHAITGRLRRALPWLLPAAVLGIGVLTLGLRLPIVPGSHGSHDSHDSHDGAATTPATQSPPPDADPARDGPPPSAVPPSAVPTEAPCH